MIINIEIEKCGEGKNTGAPRLKLKYAPSEKAPFKEYVCTLSAQGGNQTSEVGIESLSSFTENLKALQGDFNHLPPDQYLLTLPNPESAAEPLQLMIKRDGLICVQHANTPVDLTLKSFNNIDCPNAVCLQSINLTAPTITVSNHLMATERACFKANQLANSGYIESSKDLELKLIVLKNDGAILANRISGAFAKRCKTETSAVETTLENKGIIVGLDQLHLNVPGKVINEPDAAIIANKDFELQTGIFENHGRVTAKGAMTIVTKQKFHNDSASVVSAQSINVIGGKFLNEGAIVSKDRLSIVSDYSLVNRSSAKLITEDELLLCSKSKGIKIGGTVAAEKSIKIIATDQNIVLPNAKIYCTKDIELASPTEVNNSGELRAGANVQVLSGIVNNNAVAKVIASELLAITAGQHLTNAGELSGCQSVSATALHSVHNLATGNIHSVFGDVELKTFGEVMNAGTAHAHTTLAITAASLTNAAMTGELYSLDILRANILHALKNNGKIKAENLRLTSQTLDNAAEAILKASRLLMLTVRDNFHNAGNTTSEGTLEIDATVVQNMETGQIKAEGNLSIFVRELFSNQGLLKGNNAVIIEAAHFIHNLMHGKMEALGSFMLKAGGQFLNQGSIFSQQSVDIQVLVCLRKYHDKEIDPLEAFAVLDKLYSNPMITHTLDPESVINARLILDHYKRGIIKHAEASVLLLATVARNSGTIHGEQAVLLQCQSHIENLTLGKISSEQALTAIAELTLQNAGLFSGEVLRLQAKTLLNKGTCESNGNLSIHATVLENLSTGNVSAREALEVIASHAENSGVLSGKTTEIDVDSLNNTGTLKALNTLSIKVKEVFNHCESGLIKAEQAINVVVKDLYLMGQALAEKDFTLSIEDAFDYNPEILWAAGLLKIMIQKGYDFTKPIHTPGDLTIESAHDLKIHNKLHGDGVVKIEGDNITVEKLAKTEAGVSAGTLLDITAHQTLQLGRAVSGIAGDPPLVSDGSYLSSNDAMTLKGDKIQSSLGKIHTLSDLMLEALQRIENSGNMTVGGKASVIAPIFKHKLMTATSSGRADALSAPPSIKVSGTGHIAANTEIEGASFEVGGKLTHEGNFDAHSFEAFRSWVEVHRVKGGRKRFGGHHYHEQYIPRHQTLAVYASQVSSDTAISMESTTFLNGGNFHAPNIHLSKVQNFNNGSLVGQAIFRANTAEILGVPGSKLTNTGIMKIAGVLHVEGGILRNQQRTRTEYALMVKSRKGGTEFVAQEKAIPNTGIMEAGTITGKLERLEQTGGHVHSGTGGTHLEIRDEVFLQALRTTHAVQGAISRKGRNYQVEPEFIPARITSDGNQTIIVTGGNFVGKGIESTAKGENIIQADSIFTSGVQESFELASQQHRSGRICPKKSSNGGSSFSALASIVAGEGGVRLTAVRDQIKLVHTLLVSGGDAYLQAKRVVSVLSEMAVSSAYSHQSGITGLSYQKQQTRFSQTHALRSEVVVAGDMITTAQEVHLQAVQGFVQGNMSIEALNVLIDGVVEKQSLTTKTQSMGLSFFGSQAIEGTMRGKNGREALKQLFREERFTAALEQLAHAQDTGAKVIGSVQTFVDGWRLAVLVAHACQEVGTEGSPGDVVGSLTDRWGLTTPVRNENGQLIDRKFNPSFTFSYSQSTTVQESTRTIPTMLMIGGDLHIVADIVKLLDGTQIEAQNIHVQARQLLELKAAEHTQSSQSHQEGVSASFRMDGSFEGASVNGSKQSLHSVQYSNARLKARGLLNILADGKMVLTGAEVEGHDVAIHALEMIVESLQDTHEEQGENWGVAIGAEGQLTGVQYGSQSAHRKWVNCQTSIHATRMLDIFVDSLLQKGSVLSADQKLKVQGLNAGYPSLWKYEDIQDVETSRSTQVNTSLNGSADSFPVTGSYLARDAHKKGVTRATVTATMIEGTVPTEINKNASKAKEVQAEESYSIGVPIVCPNISKIKEDCAAMSEALKLLKEKFQSVVQQNHLELTATEKESEAVLEAQQKEDEDEESASSQQEKELEANSVSGKSKKEKLSKMTRQSSSNVDVESQLEERMVALILAEAKLELTETNEQKLREIIREKLNEYPNPEARRAFMEGLPGELKLRARQYLAAQNPDGYQNAALPLVAYELALFISGMAYVGVERYCDWRKRNPGFQAGEEFDDDNLDTFPEQEHRNHGDGYQPGKVHGADIGNVIPGFMPMFNDRIIMEKNKHRSKETENRPNAPDPDKKYTPAPKKGEKLPGFSGFIPDKEMTPNGMGGFRKRWKNPTTGEILEWDKQHGELEKYSKKGKEHLGSFDKDTAEQIKPPVPGRNIKKYVN